MKLSLRGFQTDCGMRDTPQKITSIAFYQHLSGFTVVISKCIVHGGLDGKYCPLDRDCTFRSISILVLAFYCNYQFCPNAIMVHLSVVFLIVCSAYTHIFASENCLTFLLNRTRHQQTI